MLRTTDQRTDVSIQDENLEDDNGNTENVFGEDVECGVIIVVEEIFVWRMVSEACQACSRRTWNCGLLLAVQDDPEDEGDDESEGMSREVENAEPIPIFGV